MPAIPIPESAQRTTTDYRLTRVNVGPIPLEDVPSIGGAPAVKAETRRLDYDAQPVDADGLPLGKSVPIRIADLAARITGYASNQSLGVAYAQAAAAKMAQAEGLFYWHLQLELFLAGKLDAPPAL